jgi:DnaJ-class molecular chaperone
MTDRQKDEEIQYETHKCPVCNGFGSLKFGQIICHACNGTGFIVIDKLSGLPIKERKKDENENSLD